MGILIDGLNLDAPPEWIFHSMGQMILARRDSGVGNLQISLAFRHDLDGKPTPESCLALAQEFVSREGISEPFEITQIAEGDALFGGFSFVVEKEFGRVWYRSSRGQLVLAVYDCAHGQRQDSEITECERIIKSAQFD